MVAAVWMGKWHVFEKILRERLANEKQTEDDSSFWVVSSFLGLKMGRGGDFPLGVTLTGKEEVSGGDLGLGLGV